MPRANFSGTDYNTLFGDLFKSQQSQIQSQASAFSDATSKAQQQAQAAASQQQQAVQAAQDSDMVDQWQNKLISDAQFGAYVATRLAATGDDPALHEKWVQYQRQIGVQAQAAVKAQQDAKDADTYDQWKNNQLSDSDWLAYLAQRVQDTRSDPDPSVNEKWVELQRQYATSIADTQAQNAYNSGDMSPSSYIAYLRQSLATMNPDTQGYRDRQAAITKLIDSQLATDVTSRATTITKGIQAGTNSYQQLLALYQDAAKKARSGSDLATQLSQKITETQGAIREQTAQGSLQKIEYEFKANMISGHAAGQAIRDIANQYYKNDQTKYYQILEGALQFEKYPGMMSGGIPRAGSGGSRSSGGGSRSGSSGSASSTASTKSTVALLRANITRGVNLTDQYLSGSQTLTDPATGQTLPATPKNIHDIQIQTLNSYDALSKTYLATGKPSDAKYAATASKDKTDFITKAVQPTNTVGPAAQTQHFISGIVSHVLSTAQASNDPLEVLQVAQQEKAKIDAYVQRLTSTQTSAYPGLLPTNDIGRATVAKPNTSQVMPQLVQELQAVSQVIGVMATPGATKDTTTAAIDFLKKSTGKFIPDSALTPLVTALGQQNQAYVGLSNGTMTLVSTPKGIGPAPVKQTTVPPATPGGAWTTKTVPDVGAGPNKANNEQWTQIYMDVNGTPTPVWAVSKPIASGYKAWQAAGKDGVTLVDSKGNQIHFAAGQYIPSSFIGDSAPGTKTAPGTSWQSFTASGAIKAVDANLGWLGIQTPSYTDNGKNYASQMWVGDPTTGTWYIGTVPVSADLNPDGTIRLDDKGNPGLVYKPYGTSGGVPVPYIGSDNKTMQAVYNSTGQDNGGHLTPDSTGKLVPSQPGEYSSAYYDPSMEPAARALRIQREDQGLGSMPSSNQPSDSNWWQDEIQSQKVSSRAAQQGDMFRTASDHNRTALSRLQGPTAATPAGSMDNLMNFAKTLGVTFGPPNQPSQSGPLTDRNGGFVVPPPTAAPTPTKPTVVLPPVTQPKANSAPVIGEDVPLPSAVAPTSAKISVPSIVLPSQVSVSPAKISVPSLPSQDLLGTGHPIVSAPPPPKPVINPALPKGTADAQVQFAPPTNSTGGGGGGAAQHQA